MDKKPITRKGERLVSYHPQGTKAALNTLAATLGQRSTNGVVAIAIAELLSKHSVTLLNVSSQET